MSDDDDHGPNHDPVNAGRRRLLAMVAYVPPAVIAAIVNPTAHALLELLAEPGTETDVGDAFVTAFPREDAAAIKRDIRALIERFLRDGILEPCGSASSTA